MARQKPVLRVVAALIAQDGRYLACRRPQGKHLAGYYEFPGGKVEPGETEPQALTREIEEELGCRVAVHAPCAAFCHEYDDRVVRLTLYRCTVTAGVPTALEHSDLLWLRPSELDTVPFCPADEEMIRKLKAE